MIAVALAAVLMQVTPAPTPAACKPDRAAQTQNDQAISPHRLNEMPPGMLMHAVVLSANSCALIQAWEYDRAGRAAWRIRTLGDAKRAPTPLHAPDPGGR